MSAFTYQEERVEENKHTFDAAATAHREARKSLCCVKVK